jgi:arylsulfatase A-like enzyme
MKTLISLALSVYCLVTFSVFAQTPAKKPPNIIFILADDLGVGELGCYGQTKIHTPNIDRLAREGMRFTQGYSPSPVCAPSRCGILTGLNMGHAYVRDNKEIQPEGQFPIPEDTVTIAERLKSAGYATACIGKWGLGPVGSSGDPIKQGFDFFFGDNCQRVAHNHYPDHVWKNDQRIELEGGGKNVIVGKHYVPDMMRDVAVKWIGENKDHPFFLYFSTTLTHLGLQAPADAVAEYKGKFEETPFVKTQGTYVSCDAPRATYAAMVTRLDQHVGAIVDQVKALGLEENTIIFFASDNGPAFPVGGTDSAFFNSAMGRKGLKGEVYEGGIHVPLIVRWPGRIAAGSTSDFATALYDFFPTVVDLLGLESSEKFDGVSIWPTLSGKGEQRQRDYLYWEFASQGGQRAIRKGNWKAVQTGLKKDPNAAVQLYDLATDPNESNDVAAKHPEIVKQLSDLMKSARTPAVVPAWNF